MNKLLYLFTLFAISVNAQKIELSVKIKAIPENTKLYIENSLLDEYYEKPIHDSILNKEGRNTFHYEKLNFYYPFRLYFKQNKNEFLNSGNFFVKNNNLSIELNNLSDEIINDLPERQNYNEFFKNFLIEERAFNDYNGNMFVKYKFDKPKEVEDSINKWYNKVWMQEINLLDQYIKANPKSVIAFWKIVEKFNSYKDYPYESILVHFDFSIKQSFPYKKLLSNIEEYKIFGQGKPFPIVNNLKDESGKVSELNFKGKKYTLIDFWFQACKPCLVTFPHLKEVYQKYHSNGFEIIAISTDNTKYVQNWENTIKKFELPWVNYLDENGVFTTKNKINSFPTNFLVDENGNILMKNISAEKLDDFLKNNLANE